MSYTLTLVATVFLPAQFLTGLYGMNFVNMPELQYEHAYMIWWGVVTTIASGTTSYFKFYKKWLEFDQIFAAATQRHVTRAPFASNLAL